MRLPHLLQRAPRLFRVGLCGAAIFFAAALIGGVISGFFGGGGYTATAICFVLVLVVEMWAYDRYLS